MNSEEVIQHALPHLSNSERGFVLTGITPEEWDDIFKEEELEGERQRDDDAAI